MHSSDGDFYNLSDKISSISGNLTTINKINNIKFTLSDLNNNILLEGKIDKNENWVVENFGFGIGYNLLTITIIKTNNQELVYKYIIINLNDKNVENLNISLDLDTDGDGLSDYYEKSLGLDINSIDTDGDGLSDPLELFLPKTNPLLYDTDGNGIGDQDEDSDGDGLSNIDEINRGLSPSSNDTDNDGLTDGDEINKYFTNPLEEDTDGDGLSDYYEINNGYDPLSFNSSFKKSITADTYEGQVTIPTVTIDGLTAEQTKSLFIKKGGISTFINSEIPGYIDCGYDFYVQGEFNSAELTFEFDISLLNDPNFSPAIYYFNEELQLLEKIENQSINGNKVTATIGHFSKYILVDETKYSDVWKYDFIFEEESNKFSNLDIVFVIDSSGSMQTNDSSNIRIDVTKKFINKLNDIDRAAIVDFDSDARTLSSFTSDKSVLLSAANGIDNEGGTNLSSGISTAINLFSSQDYTDKKTLKCIIMLTDGDGEYSNSYTSLAASNNIVIYTVGLGNSVSTSVLSSIAGGTGGNYYNASNASALYGIFDTIAEESDFNKDTDGDGINDYFEKQMAEGRLRLGTGVPLLSMNYQNNDTDGDGLLDGEEIKIVKQETVFFTKVFVSLYSNPTIIDTDGDGFHDKDDNRPLYFDMSEAWIHRSPYRKGILKEAYETSNKIARDLTYNDYSFTELQGTKFGQIGRAHV